MIKSKIKFSEVTQENGSTTPNLPKYSSSVINLASGYAHATRPTNVGQVSEEIQDFCNDETYPGHSLGDWKKWHINKHENGDGINRAIDEAWDKFQNILTSLQSVTKDHIKVWMEDFVYDKTYNGLMVQNTIIKKIASELNVNYRIANPDEEKKGIDGFINGQPVQIKSETYKQTGKQHNEETTCPVVYYKKKDKTIIFEYEKEWFD